MIVSIPLRSAARDFSFNPPMGRTLPLNVISPVMEISLLTGRSVKAETRAVVMVIPADGPSFGMLPAGICI